MEGLLRDSSKVNIKSRLGIFSESLLAITVGCRYFPAKALTFTFFNHFKHYSDSSLFGNMILGAAAGCSATLVFYPLGFARTRMGVDVGVSKQDRQFTNIFDCLRKIYKSDGILGPYRGLSVSILLTMINKSSYFGLFEAGKPHLPGIENQSHHLFVMWVFATCTTAFGYIC